MNERALEIKVGIFVLAAAAILAGFAVAIGDLNFSRGWTVHVDYGFAGAIHQGAPVRVSGMEVGRVAKVELLDGGRRDDKGRPLLIRLDLELEERLRGVLRQDTEFHIGTAGILGEFYVDGVTGRMEGEPLQPGVVVRGIDPPRTDMLMARAQALLEDFSTAIGEDGERLGDFLDSLTRFAKSTEDVLGENRERITEILAKVESATDDLAYVASATRAQLDGGDLSVLLRQGRVAMADVRRELPDLLGSLRRAGEDLESAGELLSKLDEEDVERLRATLAQYQTVGQNLETILGEVDGIVGRIDAGEGTIGGLINDGKVYEDLRDLLDELKAHPWKLLWRR